MREFARSKELERAVNRTRASDSDTYIGVLGEIVWFTYRYGRNNWYEHASRETKGQVDDPNPVFSVEVKSSKTFGLDRRNLMVREDYAHKRNPDGYVLVLFSNSEAKYMETAAHVVGFATQQAVLAAPPVERIVRETGEPQGFRNYEIPVGELRLLPEPYDVD